MADTLTSPCIGNCRINVRSGYCEGCYRTAQEIAGWQQMRLEQKRQLLEQLPQRRSGVADTR